VECPKKIARQPLEILAISPAPKVTPPLSRCFNRWSHFLRTGRQLKDGWREYKKEKYKWKIEKNKKPGRRPRNQKVEYVINKDKCRFIVDVTGEKESADLIFFGLLQTRQSLQSTIHTKDRAKKQASSIAVGTSTRDSDSKTKAR